MLANSMHKTSSQVVNKQVDYSKYYQHKLVFLGRVSMDNEHYANETRKLDKSQHLDPRNVDHWDSQCQHNIINWEESN